MDLFIQPILWNWCPSASQVTTRHVIHPLNYSHSTNMVFIIVPLSEFPVAPQTCMLWFGLQMVSFILHLTALQAVLILRG